MLRTLFVALIATAAMPAAAQTESLIPDFDLTASRDTIRANALPFISTVRQGDLFNANGLVPTNGFTGVGGLTILSGATGSRCSGALISATVVLTAAHCFGAGTTPITSISFSTPNYLAGNTTIAASGFALHPDWDAVENVIGGNDVAVIKLSQAATGLAIYDIATTDDEFDFVHTKVGLGTLGTGASGQFNPPNFDGRKHYGLNVYEAFWDELVGSTDGIVDDLAGAPVSSILMYDFDSGTAQEDSFGRLFGPGFAQRGVVVNGQNRDVSAAPGDSGGPTFVNGKIAGITSFGITADAFTASGRCTQLDSIDQAFNLSTGACTNSSFGELAGDTRVSFFADWIRTYQQGGGAFIGVPEPATWGTMIAGFAMIGGLMRRRGPARVSV